MKKIILLLLVFVWKDGWTQFRSYDLIITEWMSDPTPVIGLPNAEFVEIYNNSNDSISLINWQLGDASSTTIIRTNYILAPRHYLILCANTQVSNFSIYGDVLGVASFPSLNNDADEIILIDPSGRIIHQVSYQIQTMNDPIKSQGGYTMELIDLTKPCLGTKNVQYSNATIGGTPGKPNSVQKNLIIETLPIISNAFIQKNQEVLVRFNQNMDKEVMGNIQIKNSDHSFSFSIESISWIDARTLIIKVNEYFAHSNQYWIQLIGWEDCAQQSLNELD